MTPAPANPNPLRLGTDAEFAALTSVLATVGYNEQVICRRLYLPRISQFEFSNALRRPPRPVAEDADPVDLLIHLFLENEPLPRSVAERLPLDVFSALGLIVNHAADPDLVSGTVVLHPLRGLYIVSDRPSPVEGDHTRPPDDFVYPALVPNTDLFLDLIAPLVKPGECDSFLDLCAGTGAAALVAANQGARHAYSYDITPRSTFFAEFNRRLNGIANLTASAGDLYEPAGDLTFDRIVAHPPYVPVYRPQLIFDSGGQDGEQIVRRIIEGLPRYLRPGGRFYSLTMGSDREINGLARPFEERLREWLGPQGAEFDVAFVNRTTRTPREWAAESVIRNRGAVDDIANWRAFFESLGIKVLVYGCVMIQRRAAKRPVFTVRRQTGPRTGPAEHAWLLDWETIGATLKPAWLDEARPAVAPGAKLRVDHHFEAGNWAPDHYLLETEHPFNNEMPAQAWTAYLFTLCDGSRTADQIFQQLKTEGALHPETPALAFTNMLATLVSGGFLQATS